MSIGPTAARDRSRLDWPPRAYVWALLAAIVLPASLLTRGEAVYFLYAPLLLLALLLPAPEGCARWRLDRDLLWPLGALFAWALLTVLWSPDPGLALQRWSTTAVMIGVTLAACGAAAEAKAEERRLVAKALTAGFLAALAMLLVDLFFEAAAYRLFQDDEPPFHNARDQAGRSLFLLAMAAFALANRFSGAARLVPLLLAFTLSAVLSHMAGMLSIAVACLVWALASWNDALMRRCWIVALSAVVLIAPLQGLLLQAVFPGEADWKPRVLEVREQIWRFAAERALEKPIFGWGLEATRAMPNMGEESLRGPDGKVLPNHPHNVPLQLWLDLGIPGLALGGWVLFRLKRRVETPLAQAFLVYLLLNAVVSIGFWRPRWIALACCGVFLFCLLASHRRGEALARH